MIGRLRGEELPDLRVARVDAHEHDAVDSVVAGTPQIGVRLAAVRAGLLCREQEQVVAELADPVLEPDQHLLEERVLDVGVLLPV